MCAQQNVSLPTTFHSLPTRESRAIRQKVEGLFPDENESLMCKDIVKCEPAECNDSYMPDDDDNGGVEIQVTDIKVEMDSDLEEDLQPVAKTFPTIKSESKMCKDIVKCEPPECNDSYIRVDNDDGGVVEIQEMDIKVEMDSDLEEDPQPVAITFPTIKSEPKEDQHADGGMCLFHCAVCNKFTQECNLKTHQCKHRGERPYKCDVCEKSFTEKGNLSRHQLIHSGERTYKCDVCEKSFTEKGSLSRHQLIHSGERPYKCDVCSMSFSQNGTLKIHQRLHSGERPYKCGMCIMSFRRKDFLKTHESIHSGERPYKCNVCGKSFMLNGHLKTHQRVHSGERPYKCGVCDKSFSEKCKLNRHQRIHSGERPYKCDVCNVSFNQKGSVKRHQRIHSGERP